MPRFFILIALILQLPVFGQQHPVCDSTSFIQHTCFSLCYNEKTEQANWVSYFLTPDRVSSKTAERSDDFRPDTMVKTGSADPADYKGSGYDRGHLCPAGDMAFDSTAMSESFLMSNMCPQFPGFNRGIWNSLEQKVRKWAIEFDTLFIVSGPLFYDTTYSCIGKNMVAIPDACFKVLLGKKDTSFYSVGFIIPNLSGLKNFMAYSVTVDKAEEVSGYDFFTWLDDKTETAVEENKSNLFSD